MSITTSEEIHGKISGSGSLKGGTSATIIYTDAYNIACANGFEGTIEEWLDSLQGEPGPQGEKGEKGDKGADGTMTFADLTEEQKASLKGDPGYTPVKGTDYFTEADKAEMVADVIAALPVYDGEVVDA